MILPAWMRWTGIVFAALGVLLIALKLAGVLAWPWWLVLLPFVAPFLLAALAGIALLVLYAASGGR